MAGDNKNIKELAADAADDKTSELEILSMDLVPTDEELEMDANTFSLDESDSGEHNVATLRSDLRSKDERITDLQFDIEQLRARWTGLEKEIEAREQLTEILQTDLKAAHKNLAAKDKQLSRNERDLADLTSKLDAALAAREDADLENEDMTKRLAELDETVADQARRIGELESDVEVAKAAAGPLEETLRNEIDESRVIIADLNTYIDGRKTEWDRQASNLQSVRSALAEHEALLGERDYALEQSRQTFEKNEAERIRLAAALEDARDEIESLTKDLQKHQAEIDEYHRVERSTNEKRLAEQAGEIAGEREKIREVQAALHRSEAYADELRGKLDASREASATAADREKRAEQDLITAQDAIADLEDRLDSEQELAGQLRGQIEELTARLDSESDELVNKLAEVEEALAQSESINEQLTSDLIDSNSFKQALEDQLESISESHDEEIENLEKQTAKLQLQVEDYERKIGNKDNAISALLNELANKSRTLESISEIENVIHEIDDRMSERIDDRSVQDRERPTRLLIGTIDGQELRFPLFKDRLTIGRTVHNDIQLRAQFISRRHAVVLADEDATRIVDWGSKNGVYVNNARISEQVLVSGDKVMIGTAEFTYEELPRRQPE